MSTYDPARAHAAFHRRKHNQQEQALLLEAAPAPATVVVVGTPPPRNTVPCRLKLLPLVTYFLMMERNMTEVMVAQPDGSLRLEVHPVPAEELPLLKQLWMQGYLQYQQNMAVTDKVTQNTDQSQEMVVRHARAKARQRMEAY